MTAGEKAKVRNAIMRLMADEPTTEGGEAAT